jgi:invasion protein IalB
LNLIEGGPTVAAIETGTRAQLAIIIGICGGVTTHSTEGQSLKFAVNSGAARWLAAGVLALSANGASAQWFGSKPAAAPARQVAQVQPAPSEAPQRTTATYGDWVVQCASTTKPSVQKVCDMAQTTQVQGGNAPFSNVAIGRPVKGQPIKLVVQVPVNVSFGSGVIVRTSDADPGIEAPFARCIPNGCFAEFELKDDMLKKLRAASGTGKLSFPGAAGRVINVPVSFKGFDQAFDALSRQ